MVKYKYGHQSKELIMGVFNIMLLADDVMAQCTGRGETLYDGDNLEAAHNVVREVAKNPAYKGRTIRFYDYHLFGGCMKDVKITA
jgi:hypothetical protein